MRLHPIKYFVKALDDKLESLGYADKGFPRVDVDNIVCQDMGEKDGVLFSVSLDIDCVTASNLPDDSLDMVEHVCCNMDFPIENFKIIDVDYEDCQQFHEIEEGENIYYQKQSITFLLEKL